ncbi:MAG: CRISPR-associated ring nuclease, partial [Chloroflexota bacterium]|nr:CRISPR-associated ring nuclease [Chloroflexota bacterium]
ITVAFDRLNEQYRYAGLAVLHTEPTISGIAQAYADLRAVCARDYPNIPAYFHEIAYADGAPLIDIADQRSAEAYHRAVLEVLYAYKRDGWLLHLMLAGGRKAMSIYAMLAASALFEPPHDRVWTVLSSEAMLSKPGQFHVPAGMREQVQLVELPLRPARIAPGTDVEALLARPISRGDAFLAKLTPAEREVADLLRRNPYASNDQLGKIGNKSGRTIENQLASIYDKMIGFLDFGETISDKRQALLDLLRSE